MWHAQKDAVRVAQRAASLQHQGIAEDAEHPALEIAARYVQEPAKEPAIQPARRYAIVGAQMNALVVKGLVLTIVLVDVNMGVRPAAKILVRGVILHAQLPAPTIVREDAKAVAIRHAQRIA